MYVLILCSTCFDVFLVSEFFEEEWSEHFTDVHTMVSCGCVSMGSDANRLVLTQFAVRCSKFLDIRVPFLTPTGCAACVYVTAFGEADNVTL